MSGEQLPSPENKRLSWSRFGAILQTRESVAKNLEGQDEIWLIQKELIASKYILLNDAGIFESKDKTLYAKVRALPEDKRLSLLMIGVMDASSSIIINNIFIHFSDWNFLDDSVLEKISILAIKRYPIETLKIISSISDFPKPLYIYILTCTIQSAPTFDYKKFLDDTHKAEGVWWSNVFADRANQSNRDFITQVRESPFFAMNLNKIDDEDMPGIAEEMIRYNPAVSLTVFKETIGTARENPLSRLTETDKLRMLEIAASFGLWFATRYYDIFEIDAVDIDGEIKSIWNKDATRWNTTHGWSDAIFELHKLFPAFRKIQPMIVLPSFVSSSHIASEIRKKWQEEREEELSLLSEVDKMMGLWNYNQPVMVDPDVVRESVRIKQTKELSKFFDTMRLANSQWATDAQKHPEFSNNFSSRKTEILFWDDKIQIRLFLDLYAHLFFTSAATCEKAEDQARERLWNWFLPKHATWYAHFLANSLNPSILFLNWKILKLPDDAVRGLISSATSIRNRTSSDFMKRLAPTWGSYLNWFDNDIPRMFWYVCLLYSTLDLLVSTLSPLCNHGEIETRLHAILAVIKTWDYNVTKTEQYIDKTFEPSNDGIKAYNAEELTRIIEQIRLFVGKTVTIRANREKRGISDIIAQMHITKSMGDKVLNSITKIKKGETDLG